jgi:isoquinoline 1-oxidoreductase alpha subunit
MIRLFINGKFHNIDVEPDTPLLWAIREQVGLTGTKYGCGIALCGACTVHIDGAPVRSCGIPVSAATGKKIVDVPQCGYCQSGMIMAAAALLQKTPKPTDAQIDAAISNICRCGTFQQVREAIHSIAKA